MKPSITRPEITPIIYRNNKKIGIRRSLLHNKSGWVIKSGGKTAANGLYVGRFAKVPLRILTQMKTFKGNIPRTLVT